MKKRIAKIISIVVLMVAVIGAGLYISRQPEKKVIDMTEDTEKVQESSPSNADGEPGEENTVILSSSITILTEEESEIINRSIQSIYCNNSDQLEIVINSEASEVLAELGTGSVFFLDGNENTPFGSPYIGKVCSVNALEGSDIMLVAETPTMDEAFDSVNIDMESSLTEESLISVSNIEGVSIQYTENIAQVYEQIPSVLSENEGLGIFTLNQSDHGTDTLKYMNKDTGFVQLGMKTEAGIDMDGIEIQGGISPEGFVIEYNIDLLQLVELTKTSLSTTETLLSEEEEESYGAGRDTANESTGEKVKNDLIDSHNQDMKFSLSGKAAVADVAVGIEQDWNIKRVLTPTVGFKNLDCSLKYKFQTESKLTLCAENISFGGTKNEIKLNDLSLTNGSLGNENNEVIAKLSGLKDKLIPIACIQWTPASVVTLMAMDGNQMNNMIHVNAGISPISVAMIFYVDVSGNISATCSLECDYKQTYDRGCVFVRDEQWVFEDYGNSTEDTIWQFEAKLTADTDLHMGLAAEVYLFNICIVDVNGVKIGVEGSGSGGVRMGSMMSNPEWFADVYVRTYLKILDIHMNMQVVVNADFIKVSKGFQWDWTLNDITLAQTGTRSDTSYDPYTMSYSKVTASDEDYYYYLNENGYIVRQKRDRDITEILYTGGMTIFCGIDETYLYILRKADVAYDIYRIDKNTGTSRCVETDVIAVLTQDERNLYYLSSFDETSIQALNRHTLNIRTFKDFEDDVEMMTQYGNNYYVTTSEGGFFASFFGGGSSYYLIDTDGNIVRELGKSPDTKNLPKKAYSTYYVLQKYVQRKLLRDATVSELFWMDSQQQNVIQTETYSGWMFDNEEGIFVTLESDNTEKEYAIYLYCAGDGQRIKVADVSSDQAFFTICKDSAGYWYFFDETDHELILYQMNSEFKNLQEIVRYKKSHLNVSLKECSMEIVGNKMVFYSIVGDDNSATTKVHYRYNVY